MNFILTIFMQFRAPILKDNFTEKTRRGKEKNGVEDWIPRSSREITTQEGSRTSRNDKG